MIDMKKVMENLEGFLENPYWAGYYRDAPTERCRRFIALEFYYSEYEDGETGMEMDQVEAEMDDAELRHLLKYCGNNPRMKVLLDRIAALPGTEA